MGMRVKFCRGWPAASQSQWDLAGFDATLVLANCSMPRQGRPRRHWGEKLRRPPTLVVASPAAPSAIVSACAMRMPADGPPRTCTPPRADFRMASRYSASTVMPSCVTWSRPRQNTPMGPATPRSLHCDTVVVYDIFRSLPFCSSMGSRPYLLQLCPHHAVMHGL